MPSRRLSKMFASEYANQLAYEAIQIHGGSGYMKDYPIERIYRDARITNIYEGTTQLQVVAAIRHVTTGTFLAQMKAYEAAERPASSSSSSTSSSPCARSTNGR